jgi:hypothetical protein
VAHENAQNTQARRLAMNEEIRASVNFIARSVNGLAEPTHDLDVLIYRNRCIRLPSKLCKGGKSNAQCFDRGTVRNGADYLVPPMQDVRLSSVFLGDSTRHSSKE